VVLQVLLSFWRCGILLLLACSHVSISQHALLCCCRSAETFPRLADPLGYVDKDDIFHAIKAIVATQRDYGRRDDRKQVRTTLLSIDLTDVKPQETHHSCKQQALRSPSAAASPPQHTCTALPPLLAVSPLSVCSWRHRSAFSTFVLNMLLTCCIT
jgi:hypothetical protein